MISSLKRLAWRARLAMMGKAVNNFQKLQELQWLDPRQTRELQRIKLRRLLAYSYRHVPYYQEALAAAGVVDEKGAIRIDRFRQIPLLDKSTIRRRFEDLKSDELASLSWYENTSGGSTGEPVRLIQDGRYRESAVAVKMLDDLWSGYGAGGKKMLLWGSERDIFAGREKLRTFIGRWIRSEVWFNAFRMSHEQMACCVRKINSFKPLQILAYAGNIYELARFIEREDLEVYSPGAIMSTAGVLQPHMRQTIERVFKSPVFNRYGSREVGDVACECRRHEGLHIAAPVQYVEILRQDGTNADHGEMGEIVITNLTNYAMPLIRYRIGDMGVLSDRRCSCGIGWPLLSEVAGRTSDIFMTKEGTQVNGEYFTHLFYFRDWVGKFQVVQEDYDRINISIVPHPLDKETLSIKDEMGEITGKIMHVMGEDCKVSYAFVDDIEPTSSGKYRYTVSKITA